MHFFVQVEEFLGTQKQSQKLVDPQKYARTYSLDWFLHKNMRILRNKKSTAHLSTKIDYQSGT